MDANELLAFARGPAFDIALIVFVGGMLLRLFEVLSLGRKADLSAPRASGVGGGVRTVGSTEPSGFDRIPSQGELDFDPKAAYVHFTSNNTIMGTQFHEYPDTGDVPLVADMSSDILWRPIDANRFNLIYAGAQKNIGPAGLTLVIVRDDLIGNPITGTPTMFNYATQASAGSMYNTPPTYGWYLAGLVFRWLHERGGLAGMAAINERKAKLLYGAIDASDFYANPVDPTCRSWMNVPFTLTDPDLDSEFLEQAGEAGLKTLKGHRSVGGMRASIYNAFPAAGCDALVQFMKDFEALRPDLSVVVTP